MHKYTVCIFRLNYILRNLLDRDFSNILYYLMYMLDVLLQVELLLVKDAHNKLKRHWYLHILLLEHKILVQEPKDHLT